MGFLDSLKKLFGGKKEQTEETQAPAEQAPISGEMAGQAPEQTEGQGEQQPPEEGGSEERL